MSLGKNFKKIRTSKNITQKELAEKLGVSVRTIQNYESGNREPKLDIIKEIAAALEVNLSQLISGVNFDTRYKINPNADFKSIKKYREEMKISQEELSELIGIKLEDLKEIEAGTISNPRIDYAIRLDYFFKPIPPFCLHEEINSLFDGPGILTKTYNNIFKYEPYQINNLKLDKKTILTEYIEVFSKSKNINLEPSEIKNILDFLLAAMDPLLEYKINEILQCRENNK